MSPLNIFLFLTGVSRLAMFDFGGQLYLTDLLLAACFFFLVLDARSRRRLFTGPVLLLIILAALWLLNAIITDIYRLTPFEDWSRGWSKIVFFLLDLLGLVLLTELRLARISVFLAGLSFSWLIEPRFFPNEHVFGIDNSWKFAYSPGLTIFAALAGASAFARRGWGGIVEWAPLAALGVVNLVFDYRSIFGVAMAAAAFGILKQAIDLRPQLRAKITPVLFGVLIVGGLVFSQGVIAVYETAADNGWLGPDARDKYLAQTSGDLGLIASGRAESLVSVRAIADAPIIGHGSWAKDDAYTSLMVDILRSKGIEVADNSSEGALIPTHSHLSSAWVEAEIMGGVFWLAVIGIAIKALYVTLKQPEAPATFVGYVLFVLLWDVLFSPFGAEQRYLMSSKICVALWALAQARHNANSSGRENVGVFVLKFSIVTISLNQAQFLERAILSVLSQKGVDFEYIVVDPGSTDGSREIIERYRPSFSHVVYENDIGPADGLNKGFARATGDVYCYLNSDDAFELGALLRAAQFLDERSEFDVICGHAWVTDRHDNRLRRVWSEPFRPLFVAYGAATQIQPSTFIRRDAFIKAGGFNRANRSSWDGELLVDLFISGARIGIIDEFLSSYRLHAESITNSGSQSAQMQRESETRFRRLMGRTRRPSDTAVAAFFRLAKHLRRPLAAWERIARGPVFKRGVD